MCNQVKNCMYGRSDRTGIKESDSRLKVVGYFVAYS